MKSSSRFILILILTLILSACAPAPATPAPAATPPACPLLRIGVVIAAGDLTAGREQKVGYEMAVAEINQAGGVSDCKVKLYYPTDAETLTQDSAELAMLNLVENDVIAVLGATSTQATKRAVALANYFKLPFLISTDTGDDVIETGVQWLFRTPPQNSAYANAAFDMVKANLTAPKIAVVYERTEYGESAAVTAGSSVLSRGLNLVLYQGYDSVQLDYATLLTNIKNAGPEVVYLINSDPAQARALLDAIRNPQSKVKNFASASVGVSTVIGNGGGFTSLDFLYDSSGSLVSGLENLLITAPWHTDLSSKVSDPALKDSDLFASNLKAYQQLNASGGRAALMPSTRIVEAYNAVYVTVDAMKELVAVNPDWIGKLRDGGKENMASFREALAKRLREPQSGYWKSLIGAISFDAKGQNQREGLLLQVINGKLMTVYPDRYKSHEVVLVKGW